jgi:protein subunit release factor B
MSELQISNEKQTALQQKMAELAIFEQDIQEHFIKAGGPGGQKINKTAVCVYLKHLPTGIEIKCRKSRSQAANRFFARRLLVDKIESLILKKQTEKQKLIAKKRKQKKRRSKKAKEKILKQKKIRSEKKQLRSKINPTD